MSFVAVELRDIVFFSEVVETDDASVLLFAFLRRVLVGLVSYSAHGGLCKGNSVDSVVHVSVLLHD